MARLKNVFIGISLVAMIVAAAGIVLEPFFADLVLNDSGAAWAKKSRSSSKSKTYKRPKMTKFSGSSSGNKRIPWSRKKAKTSTTGKAGIKPDLKKTTPASKAPPSMTKPAPSTGKAGLKPDLKSTPARNAPPPMAKTAPPKGKAGLKPDLKSSKPPSSVPPPSKNVSAAKPGIKPSLAPVREVKPKNLSKLNGSALDRQIRLRNSDKRLKEARAKKGFGKPARITGGTINTKNPLYRKATLKKTPMTYKSVRKKRGEYYKKRKSRFGKKKIDIDIDLDGLAPAYGMFSAMFLMDALSNWNNDPDSYSFLYNNWNDPGMRAYMLEMKGQTYDNPNLRNQISLLEARVARQKMENVKRTEGYLPKGVAPEIALAQEIVATPEVIEATVPDDRNLPVVAVGTAPVGGLYNMFGVAFASYARGFRVETPESRGSVDNLDGFGKRYSVIVAQSDAVDKYLRDHGGFKLGEYQFPVIDEFFQAVVNRKSKIEKISDVGKGTVVIPGPSGGGPSSSWENVKFHAANGKRFWNWDTDKYADAGVQNLSYNLGIRQLETNPNAVLLYVGGLHSPLMEQINRNYGKKMKLIPFNEDRFLRAEDKEGNAVYNEQAIPANTYPNLQDGWVFTSVDSLTVQMILAVHDSLFTKHPEIRGKVEDALARTIMDIQKIAGYRG